MADRKATRIVAALAVAALVAGCGGDSEPASTFVQPGDMTDRTISAPTAVTEEGSLTDALTTATTQTSTTPTATTPSRTTTVGPGAGDEEAARVPAVFTIEASGVTPREVKVPAFLSIELTGVSEDGADHTLGLSAGAPYVIAIPAGGRTAKVLPGLRPGTYRVILDGRQTSARLEVGGEPGP